MVTKILAMNIERIKKLRRETIEWGYKIEHLRGSWTSIKTVCPWQACNYAFVLRTMANIAFEYGVAKSTICECVKWTENILIKSGEFSLSKRGSFSETLR